MNHKNDKNTKLILTKNRRILTRTELSKHKLQTICDETNFICQTPRIKEPKTLQCIQRKNPTSFKINLKDSQSKMQFWKTAKKNKLKTEFSSNRQVQAQKYFDDQKQKQTLRYRDKGLNTRIFNLVKGKIFSHKNLYQSLQRSKNKQYKSSSKIHQQNQSNLEINENKILNKYSSRDSQFLDLQANSKISQQRIKTENYSNNQQLEELLQNIYTNKRRKLKINSKQFSVELKLRTETEEKKPNNQQNRSIQSENIAKFDSARTQNKKQSLRLSKEFITKINNRQDRLIYSSNQETPKHKNSSKLKGENQNQQQNSQICQKNKETIDKTKPNLIQLKTFMKKDSQYQLNEAKNKYSDCNTLSIQDIKIDCESLVYSPRSIQQLTNNSIQFQIEKKLDKIKIQKDESKISSKNTHQNIQQRMKKTKIKQEIKAPIAIKKKDKASIYADTKETDFIEEINLDVNIRKLSTQNKNTKQETKNLHQIQKTSLIRQNILQNDKVVNKNNQQQKIIQKDKKGQVRFKQYDYRDNLRIQFKKAKQKLDYLTCTGEVAGYCLQLLPKKNLIWMAPSLLLYHYCFNVSERSRKIYDQALKNQLCSQNQHKTFIQENQLLKLNFSKLFQKAKKKGVLNEAAESLISYSSEGTSNEKQFFQVLFNEVSSFTTSLINGSAIKDVQQRKNHFQCGLRMILSFLKAFRSKFQGMKDEYNESGTGFITNKMILEEIKIPQVKFEDLTDKKAQNTLTQLSSLMRRFYQKFHELLKS